MKLATKLGIVTAASVALIGGAAFAAPSFAVDSTEGPQTQSQEKRQLHKDAQSAERSADCDHTEEEKAAHRSERQAEREANVQGEGKRMGAKGKGPHTES
jgi:hypothetical protein